MIKTIDEQIEELFKTLRGETPSRYGDEEEWGLLALCGYAPGDTVSSVEEADEKMRERSKKNPFQTSPWVLYKAIKVYQNKPKAETELVQLDIPEDFKLEDKTNDRNE